MKKIVIAISVILLFPYRLLHLMLFALWYWKPVYISIPLRKEERTGISTHKGMGYGGFWGSIKTLFSISTKENENNFYYLIAKDQQEIYNGRPLKLWL